MSLYIASAEFSIINLTAFLSLWWSPAVTVSFMCFSTSSVLSRTAAIPPWAKFVLESINFFFVIRITLPFFAAWRAKLSPEIPEPITRKFVCMIDR